MDDRTLLLPCPFCSGAPAFVKHSTGVRGTMGFDSWDAVACRSCGGTVGACDRRFRDKGDAAKAWNTRPAEIGKSRVSAPGAVEGEQT